MTLRHAVLGTVAILLLGACVSASGATKTPAAAPAAPAPAAPAPAAQAPAAATPAKVAELTGIEAFRGSWVGATQGEGDSRRAAALVVDASADGGLFLRWRSAEGANDGAGATGPLTMRENTALFPPGKTPGVWSTRLESGARAKARLEGSVLTTELTASTGGKTEVQSYRRTLTAPGKLSLRYTRTVGGKVEDTIDADFVKLP
ncbi:hypothetical protein [Inquilinus limosus]|uniref:THAP4-like heme-binding beta-barrel domain-containing protein n=1 Tax=Inquilinus limosus MP06 TaxID=1398085 RepID=A0A0A0D271_9PROT|nr:hypothetical protein [Inquilinus limosus]KGM32154.1 hypothetical protein P409_23045 [Inquilinus limosus MP06]